MEWAFVFFEIGGGEAVTNYHVGTLLEDWFDHCWCRIGWVGVIAVDHDITFGVDLAEHMSNDIAFALFVFMANNGASFLGELSRIVGGIIVVNINRGFRKSFFKVSDNLFDGFGFVVAWDKNGDFIFFHVVSFD